MKMKSTLLYFIYLVTLPFLAGAQQITATKFILPDGREITPDKLDSVKKAWNGERILFQHDKKDDEKHVMRLVRMTPEMARTLEELAEKGEKAMKAMIGKPAPDFTLRDINGNSLTLSSLKGKIVVVNFWFTSCPPCVQEMPQLNGLVGKFKEKNVVFLALTFNDKKTVEAFLKEHTFSYSILPLSGQVDKRYQISSWPTSFVIGRDGMVKAAIKTSENVFAELSGFIEQEQI